MWMCLAPLVLVGSLTTVQTSWHHTASHDGAVVEVQTCERGLGLHAKAATSGLYALGAQYGFAWQSGPWSATIQPSAGLSYADHPVHALPLRTQFEVGLSAFVGYRDWRVGVSYWHLSNAGLKTPNIGLDLIAIQAGWVFTIPGM